MVAFLRDRRGAVAIQVALFLPILVVIVIGAFEVWKILYVRQTLNDAAYQGIRLLCMQPNHQDIAIQTEALIRRSAERNPFIRDLAQDSELFRVQMQVDPRCGHEVDIDLALTWTIGREWRGATSAWMPFLGRIGRLRTSAVGWVLCERERDAG